MTYLALIARSRLGYAQTAHLRGILSSSQIITVRLDATSYLPHQKLSSGSSGNNAPSTVVVFSLHLSIPNHFLSFPFQTYIPRITESLPCVDGPRRAPSLSRSLSLSPSLSPPLSLIHNLTHTHVRAHSDEEIAAVDSNRLFQKPMLGSKGINFFKYLVRSSIF